MRDKRFLQRRIRINGCGFTYRTTFLHIIIKTRPNDPVWNFVKKTVDKNSFQAAKGGSLWPIKTGARYLYWYIN